MKRAKKVHVPWGVPGVEALTTLTPERSEYLRVLLDEGLPELLVVHTNECQSIGTTKTCNCQAAVLHFGAQA